MRLFKIGFLALTFFITSQISAQDKDIPFLIKKITDNYAGYFDKVKGKDFTKYVNRIISQERKDTFRMLGKITAYFDNPHLRVYAPEGLAGVSIDTAACTANLRSIKRDLAVFKSNYDPHEGYWITDRHSTIIAIRKDKDKRSTYNLYLVASRNTVIPPGYLLGQMEPTGGNQFIGDFMLPGNGARLFLKSEFKNDTILATADLSKWKKLPAQVDAPNINNFRIIPQLSTSGRLIDSDNYLLTFPDFGAYNVGLIDSMIKMDSAKIASVKNLIIDVRGNTGGTVRNYTPLVPFVYTDPIIGISGYSRCTPDLLQQKVDAFDHHKKEGDLDPQTISEVEQEIAQIKRHMGTFFFQAGDTLRRDRIMPTPRNVGIIIDFACESATEMMLLDFKQSKKVTLFGEHTRGAVDYLDAYSTDLPSGRYVLTLATVKRAIPPGQHAIDGKGIYPDVSIPTHLTDWVQFVKEYYEKRSTTH